MSFLHMQTGGDGGRSWLLLCKSSPCGCSPCRCSVRKCRMQGFTDLKSGWTRQTGKNRVWCEQFLIWGRVPVQ